VTGTGHSSGPSDPHEAEAGFVLVQRSAHGVSCYCRFFKKGSTEVMPRPSPKVVSQLATILFLHLLMMIL
jgi:hypothetical protein